MESKDKEMAQPPETEDDRYTKKVKIRQGYEDGSSLEGQVREDMEIADESQVNLNVSNHFSFKETLMKNQSNDAPELEIVMSDSDVMITTES